MGEFVFSANVPLGEQILKISKTGYITKRFPIVVNETRTVDITDMTLEFDVFEDFDAKQIDYEKLFDLEGAETVEAYVEDFSI